MDKWSVLVKAVRKGQCSKAAELLQEATVNINELDAKTGKGLLQLAMENCDEDMFGLLTAYPGASPEVVSREGEYPLETAIRLNYSGFVDRLLEMGVNPRRRNAAGESALQVALKNQISSEILKKMINKKFDINERIETHGSYVNLTVIEGQTDNLQFLLQHGAKYSQPDDDDNTCLILAVLYSRGDIVMALLQHLSRDDYLSRIEKQLFVNAQNKEGNTALHEATIKGQQTVAERLERSGKEFGIDLTIKNKNRRTVPELRLAQQAEREKQLLLEKKRAVERILRKREKQQEKAKLREEQERNRDLEAKRKKKESQRAIVEAKTIKELTKKRGYWILAIVVITVLALMYVALANAVEKQRIKSA